MTTSKQRIVPSEGKYNERVVIPSWNMPGLLEFHLHAHQLFTPESVELVVAVQSGADEDADKVWDTYTKSHARMNERFRKRIALVESHDDTVLPNYSTACNRAAVWNDTVPSRLIWLNDDTVPNPTWHSHVNVEAAWLHAKKPGLVGIRSDFISGMQYLTGTLLHRDEWVVTADPGLVITAAAWMPGKVFEACGGFDEEFGGQYSDNALCERVKRAGYRLFVGKSYVSHMGHVASTMHGVDLKKQMKDARARFVAKYRPLEH